MSIDKLAELGRDPSLRRSQQSYESPFVLRDPHRLGEISVACQEERRVVYAALGKSD